MARKPASIRLLVQSGNPVEKRRLLDRLNRLLAKDNQMAKWGVSVKEVKAKAKKAIGHNSFTCWYCHNGHRHETHQTHELLRWTVCLACGATTVDMPNYKMRRNKLGGASGISWGKSNIPSPLTSSERLPQKELACKQL